MLLVVLQHKLLGRLLTQTLRVVLFGLRDVSR